MTIDQFLWKLKFIKSREDDNNYNIKKNRQTNILLLNPDDMETGPLP